MSELFVYKPSRWGEVFHNLPHDEALGAGAAGPGKTMVLLMDPMAQIAQEHARAFDKNHEHPIVPGNSLGWALHLRRTIKELEQTIVRTHRMFKAIDPGANFDTQKTTWTFSSGYRYQFGHCQNAGDWSNYLSGEYTHIAFDELVTFLEEQYDQIRLRLRSSDPLLRLMLKTRAMSNPMTRRSSGENYSIDPLWVRKRFVDPAPQGGETLKTKLERPDGTVEWETRIYLRATLYDNPDPSFVRRYERLLLGAKPHIRAAMLYGNWYITEGSFYGDEWNDKLHVRPAHHIPDDWLRFRSMDWGYKKPGCVHWWAMDPDGNLICERELTFQGKTAKQVAKRIREIEKDLKLWKGKRSLLSGPADTQLWEKRGESGKSKAEEMAAEGVYWVPADKKSRERNAERVSERLKDHGNGTLTPGMVFFENCKMAIRTIPSIQTDPGNPDCPMDGGEDHWHDSVCYAAAFASRGRVGIPALRRENNNDGDDDDESERGGRGRYGYGSAAC